MVGKMTRDLAHFTILAFALSWTAWILAARVEALRDVALVIGTFGPAVSALILVLNRPAERCELLARLFQWRCPIWTYGYALALPVLGMIAALGIARLVTGSGAIFPAAMPAYVPVLVFLYVLFLSVAGEELGWRGFALPRLLRAHNPVVASLVLGAIWALWHGPLFFIPGNFHSEIPPQLFAVQVIASSMLYTHLHYGAGGSLIPAHVFHASFNTSVGLLPVLPVARGGDITALLIAVLLLCGLALLTALRLARRG